MASKLVFVLVAIVIAAQAEDYCSKELSCGNTRNIMCNAQRNLGPSCKDASIIPITNKIRQRFVNGHNQRRSSAAQGKLGRFYGTATRMATMVWNRELERSALQNVLQCRIQHDQCRRTRRWPYAGQNLALTCKDNVMQAVEDTLNMWWNEHPQLHTESELRSSNGQAGHFAQMVRDKAFAVGCAMVRSMSTEFPGFKCYYVACNYATSNMGGSPIYEVGRMGSKCRSGMNPRYPGLCSRRESYYDDKVEFQG